MTEPQQSQKKSKTKTLILIALLASAIMVLNIPFVFAASTRFYLPSAGAANISPAYSTAWEKTTQAGARLLCVTAKTISAMASITVNENVATTPYDILSRQYVSGPIAAQTIQGTVSGQIRCSEANAATDADVAMIIRVVSNNGAVERGTLLSYFPAVLTNEYYVTTLTNRMFPSIIALNPVTTEDNDRIVIEIGTRVFNAITTSYSILHNYGDNAVDLAVNNSTTTAQSPWIEFSQTIIFINADYNGGWVAGNATGYTQGWTEGNITGYSQGWTAGNSTGFDSGYSVGYTEGNSTGYTSGFSAGWESGNLTGYNNGWNAGNETGYINGWNIGNATGYVDGYDAGFNAGNASGYSSGWVAGNLTGYSNGWDLGNAIGYSDGYNLGWINGNATGIAQGWTLGNSTGFVEGWSTGNETGYAQGWNSGNFTGYSQGYTAGLLAGQQVQGSGGGGGGGLPSPNPVKMIIRVIDWLDNPISNATVTVSDYYHNTIVGTNQTDNNGTTMIKAPYATLEIQVQSGNINVTEIFAHKVNIKSPFDPQETTIQLSLASTITQFLTMPILNIPLYLLIIAAVIIIAAIYLLLIQKVKA
jgi:hypothetical protein